MMNKSFDTFVNESFLNEYGDRFYKKYEIEKEDGSIDIGKIREIYDGFNGKRYPYRFIYVLINGPTSYASQSELSDKYARNQEAMYKKCIDEGITWQKLTGFKRNPNVLY